MRIWIGPRFELSPGDLVTVIKSPYIVWEITRIDSSYCDYRISNYTGVAYLKPKIAPVGLTPSPNIAVPCMKLKKLSEMEIIAMASR